MLLDKCKSVRTAVAKRGFVQDEYRTFDMEAQYSTACSVAKVHSTRSLRSFEGSFVMQRKSTILTFVLVGLKCLTNPAIEVIAGEEDTVVELKEFGLKLQFDFRKAGTSIHFNMLVKQLLLLGDMFPEYD